MSIEHSDGVPNRHRVRILTPDLTNRCRRSVSPLEHRTQRTGATLATTSKNNRSQP
jgi:hypothetical protein